MSTYSVQTNRCSSLDADTSFTLMGPSPDELCAAIHSILDKILALQDVKTVSYAQYSRAYNIVYNLVMTQNPPPPLTMIPGMVELKVAGGRLRLGSRCLLKR